MRAPISICHWQCINCYERFKIFLKNLVAKFFVPIQIIVIRVQVVYLQFNTFETALSRYNSEVSAISRTPQVAVLPVEYSEDYVLWT